MGVFLEKILFQDEFTGTYSGGGDSGIPNLIGCIGDFTYATIKCYVEWKIEGFNAIFSSGNSTITLNNTASLGGGYVTPPQLSKNNTILAAFLGNSFINSGFKVGDTFTITGSTSNNGNYTIKSLTDTVITTVEHIAIDATNTGVNIYGTTTVNYMDFYYNIIGSKSGVKLESTTDKNTFQKFTGKINSGYETTSALNPNTTSQAWWIKTVNGISCIPTVTNEGVEGFRQRFTIVFPFLITPLFESNQLQLLQNIQSQIATAGSLNVIDYVKPSYFTDDCLNFIYQIDFKYALTNSVSDQSSYQLIDFGKGNTSWFNSFFPSGVDKSGTILTNTGFWVKSITYTDNSGNILPSIDINNPTNIKLVVAHQSTNMSNDPFVLNFMGLPVNQGVLQGYQFINQANYREVFLHDRCLTSVGAASVNGDMFGLINQAITGVTTTSLGANIKQINFTIDLGSLSKSTLAALTPNNANYLIFVTPQSATSTSLITADRSAIIGDVNKGFINTDDGSLLQISTDGTSDVHFYNYGIGTLSTGSTTDVKGFSGDYFIAKCGFKLKKGCVLNSINVGFEVEIYKPNDYYYGNEIVDSFMIESWIKNTAQFFNKQKTEISIAELRNYLLPANDKRNLRAIGVDDTVGDGSYYGYKLLYGFQLDYHWWINNTNVTAEFEQFPANYWALYTQGYTSTNTGNRAIADGFGSNIKFKIVWNILDPSTNIITQFISYSNVTCNDDGGNTSGATCQISTTDLNGISLFEVIPSDIPFIIQAVVYNPNGFNPATIKSTIIMYYNTGSLDYFDKINTTDSANESPNSFFSGLPHIFLSVDHKTATVLVTADFTTAILPIKNCTIFVKTTS